jgi:hypothetical protein
MDGVLPCCVELAHSANVNENSLELCDLLGIVSSARLEFIIEYSPQHKPALDPFSFIRETSPSSH